MKMPPSLKKLLPILLFLAVAAAGFHAIPFLAVLSLKMELFPKLFNTPEGPHILRVWLFDGGIKLWVASVLAGLGYFFTRPPHNMWLLYAPLYVPLGYGLGVLLFFGL